MCGGALRSYLTAKDELPEASLSAMTPFFDRDGEMLWLQVLLGTDIADPAQRLAFIHKQTASSDARARAAGARELRRLGQTGSAATLALAGKLLGQAALSAGRREPLASCSVADVPGPSVPLYLCGARMTYFSAIMPIADGMGLAFAVTSYDGKLVISPTSCRYP